MKPHGLVGALVTLALGTVLTYAVHYTVAGISIRIVGIIVMLAGAAALVATLVSTVGRSQRYRRNEARQDTMLRTRNQPTARAYGQNPPQAYAPPAPASVADPYLNLEQRAYNGADATAPYQTVERDQRSR